MDNETKQREMTLPVAATNGHAPAVTQPQADAGSLMGAIIAAGNTPGANVDNMERMMAMYERLESKKAEQAFNAAMVAAQTEMRPVAADANNPQTRSKYATYHALDRALRPIYTKHGFSPSFDTDDSPKPEHIRVVCYLSHRDGHTRTYKVDVPCDGKGAKGGDVMTKTHAAGAAMSYGQRYLFKGMFNISVGDDYDGNSQDENTSISEDQIKTLSDMLERDGASVEMFCKFMKVPALDKIRAKDFSRAVMAINEAAINRKARAQKEGKQ